MSLLSEYEARTVWKLDPISGRFPTHPALRKKIDEDGQFRPFLGSTVTFRLSERDRRPLLAMEELVRERVGDMLAEPLPKETLHMTLHDLINPENAGTPRIYAGEANEDYSREYIDEVEQSLEHACGIIEGIQSEYSCECIAVYADRVVNMMSKSLVLLLMPASERDFELLLELYRRFDAVKPLPYPLTPHVTLAYFRPGEIDGDRLEKAVREIPVVILQPIELSISKLTAQLFLHMGCYEDVSRNHLF